MKLSKRRIAIVALVALAALAISGGAYAVFPSDSVTHFTGCLNTSASPGGTFVNVAQGENPSKACGKGQVLAHLSGGDVTSVNAGTGLAGGGENGAVTLSLATGQALPQTCSSDQVPKWNGTGWECGSDNNTSYSGSDFALSNQSCTSGHFGTGVDATGNLTCAAPPTPPSTTPYLADGGEGDVGVLSGQFNDVISLTVPSGTYAITAKGRISDLDRDEGTSCWLAAGAANIDHTIVNTEDGDGGVVDATVALLGTATFAANNTIKVTCETDYAGVVANDFKILALRVG